MVRRRIFVAALAVAIGWVGFPSSTTALEAQRCGTPDRAMRELLYGRAPDPSDCSASSTNPKDEYDPGETLTIPVVVHVLRADNCTTGNVSDALINSQISILNEDFQALAGTPGADGINAAIKFVLASQDPDGNPTNGITRHCNTEWHNDGGSYWDSIAWDPANYMNLYTANFTDGTLGYVPFLPADGGGSMVGTKADRVVIQYDLVGRNAPGGAPYDQGRTSTHEVGHFLGLEHTFNQEGSCGSDANPACYGDGDLICDTPTERDAAGSGECVVGDKDSCGSDDPVQNYMNYSDDVCMTEFTREQLRRNRCSLLTYRAELVDADGGGCEFNLRLPSDTVRAGEDLRYQLRLFHLRPETVTTGLKMRFVDAEGNLVQQQVLGVNTFVFNEESRIDDLIRIPADQAPGVYYLTLGLDDMLQGSVYRRVQFTVVD